MCDTAMLLCYTLEDDVFLKTTVETTIPAMVEFYREYFQLEYGYLSQYSNYLLLEIRSEAEWDKWIALPWLSVCADPWRNDSDEIMAARRGHWTGYRHYRLRWAACWACQSIRWSLFRRQWRREIWMPCGVIEQAQVEAYVRHLQDWGIPCYGLWEDAEEAFRVVAKSGESSMMIKWTPEETLIYLTEPVGGLIPEFYFGVLME